MTSDMERVLGARIERSVLPGRGDEPRRALYVSFDVDGDPTSFLKQVVWHAQPPLASSGGVVFDEWIVAVPGGMRFYALVLNGDLAGWHEQITRGAHHHGALTAGWSGDDFCLSDGRRFDIGVCRITESWSQ